MEGLRGLREVRGEGKGLKGMAYGTRPVDLEWIFLLYLLS